MWFKSHRARPDSVQESNNTVLRHPKLESLVGNLKIAGAILGVITWGFMCLWAIAGIIGDKILILIGEILLVFILGNFLAFLLILIDWLGERVDNDAPIIVPPSPKVITVTQQISRTQDPKSSQYEVIKCPSCGYNNNRKRKSCKICLEPFV